MKAKTAVLVVHGIGEQDPFETLDAFAVPFMQCLEQKLRARHSAVVINKVHRLKQFPNWVESCIHLSSDDPQIRSFDVYEYYWGHLPQRQITAKEVMDWTRDVAKGAEEFYEPRQEEMSRSSKNAELFKRDGEFKRFKYMVKLMGGTNPIWRALGFVLRWWADSNWIIHLVMAWLRRPLVDVFGDVALYCSVNKKSKYYDVRRHILDGCVTKARCLLASEEYDQVLFVGHSLGTVIAYDTLQYLNRQMNVDEDLKRHADKVAGLVTFGSPLDKIAFFFDEKVNQQQQPVRYAIVSQLHGFRRVNVDRTTLGDGIVQHFQNIPWLNFWTKPDPVSGHLDVYAGVDNIELDFSAVIGKTEFSMKSHCLYWQDQGMYQRIIEEYRLA